MVAFQRAIVCNLRLKSYGVLKILAQVWACSQPLWMQQNLPKLPKIAKICQKTKLWNTTKNQDFNVFQRYKLLRVEGTLKHVSTMQIFNPKKIYMLFLLSKNGLCVWISAYPLVNFLIFFQCSTPLVGVRFSSHASDSTRNKIVNFGNPYWLQKIGF